MRLGKLDIENPFIMAPMAGVTDSAYRSIVRRFDTGLIFTEMISAEALYRGNWRTLKFLEWLDRHHPVGLQIVGHDPDTMARAAELAETYSPDFIDINAGCPQLKITRPGSGGALLKDPEKLCTILEAVRDAVQIPVSVKIRLGWDTDMGLEIASMLQNAGAEFITVHGRTVNRKYLDRNDWESIARIVGELDIPVIANGDVKKEEDALEMLEKTGAEGVMIGRAARGRPDICGTAYNLLQNGEYQRMENSTLAQTIIDHAEMESQIFGEEQGMRRMRKHVHWYLRAAGIGCKAIEIYSMETQDDLEQLVEKLI